MSRGTQQVTSGTHQTSTRAAFAAEREARRAKVKVEGAMTGSKGGGEEG